MCLAQLLKAKYSNLNLKDTFKLLFSRLEISLVPAAGDEDALAAGGVGPQNEHAVGAPHKVGGRGGARRDLGYF